MAEHDELTRRDLLKRGLHAGAGLGLFTIIPASALGAPGRRRRVAAAAPAGQPVVRAAPGSRLGVGLVGIGSRGGGALRTMLGTGDVQVLAVADVDKRTLDAGVKLVDDRYGAKGCAGYNDFRELMARDDIDAVVISVPDHWHALISIEAAKNGKDIYCEKPLALTIRQARGMVDAVRRCDRVFQTGSQQRSTGPFRLVCELIRSGRIGKVHTVYVAVGGPSGECFEPADAVPPGFDWEMWLGPAPWRPFSNKIHPYKWRAYRDYSGGGMTDWGAHHFDIVQWALDMDGSGPVEVHPPDGKDYKYLTYRYATGVTVSHVQNCDQSIFQYCKGNGIRFVGTDGQIEVNRGGYKAWPDSVAKDPIGPNEVHLYKSPGHFEDWLSCIRTRQRPICDVEIGCRSVTVCHIGNLAYWLKRPIRWDPEKEEILGDDEAARWLDRPMRAPWHLV